MGKSYDNHLTLELYLFALQGDLSLEALLHLGHAHLLERCPECRGAWDDQGGGLPAPFGQEPVEDDPDATSHADVEESIRRLSVMRKLDREAREDVEHLLRTPRNEWQRKVEVGRTRFRTRAFAQRLLSECRERVRNDPLLAADLVALVPTALRWATEDRKRNWALILVARAEAYHANALRVSGDLAGASMRFTRLEAQMAKAAWASLETDAEISSLHASLLVEQGRHTEADELLVTAARLYAEACEVEGAARVRLKRANLAGVVGNHSLGYQLHVEAAALLDQESQPNLYLGAVTGQVLTLTDLGRLENAQSLLEENLSTYEAHGGDYGSALWKCLSGRLALARGRPQEAGSLLAQGRDEFVRLGRTYDAALVSLDLFLALLDEGASVKAAELGRDLVEVFEDLDTPRDIMASLRLLADAVTQVSTKVRTARDVRQMLRMEAFRRSL